jgi:hypothetical protein
VNERFLTDPTVNKGWIYHPEYLDKFPEYPDIRSIWTKDRSIRLSLSRISVKED